MPPQEAKFLLQRLVQVSFAIPAEPPQPGEEGVVLKTAETPQDGCILPAFTHPSLLSEYARTMGWLASEDDILPSHCMDAKELFAHMAQTEGIQLAINPGKSILKFTPADCERLSRGETPDLARLIGSQPLMTTSAMIRAMGFESATERIPDRILNVVRMFLTNEPTTSYALVFTIGPAESAPEVNVGIRFSVARNATQEKLVEKVESILLKNLNGSPPVKVLILEDPLEPAVKTRVKPFFKRG